MENPNQEEICLICRIDLRSSQEVKDFREGIKKLNGELINVFTREY